MEQKNQNGTIMGERGEAMIRSEEQQRLIKEKMDNINFTRNGFSLFLLLGLFQPNREREGERENERKQMALSF